MDASYNESQQLRCRPCLGENIREEQQKVEPVMYEQDEFVERPWCAVNEEHIQAETPKVDTSKTNSK